ncbi:MAG: phosphatidate cytidylyltransferase [Ilumatobacter sp.]
MSDDIWRNDDEADSSAAGRRPGRYESSMDEFDSDEFGGPLFGDDSGGVSAPSAAVGEVVTGEHTGLSLDDDSTGPLPHWTEPATGEMPKIESVPASGGDDDDLDVWSTFTSESPVWKEGDSVDEPSGTLSDSATIDEVAPPSDPTGELSWENDPIEESAFDAVSDELLGATDLTDSIDADVPPRDPPRITIGTDPSGMPRRPDPARRGSTPQRPPSAAGQVGVSDKRNLPVAIATGAGLAIAFLGLTIFVGPLGALGFAVLVLALAGVEYFGKVSEKGYRPSVAPGVVAIVAAPLAGYWVGERGVLLVVVFAFLAAAIGFIGATSIESGPMPNMAITMLGIIWIGVLGAYVGMLLDVSNISSSLYESGNPWGTDTLVLLAVGVVANDVGAYFVGSAFGRTPLRAWISPGKSAEGWLGGTILTLLVMVIVYFREFSDTWSQLNHLLMLGLVISFLAPLGDLTESMFKRNLDVKDFGTLIRGHGGVLDRFDGFLFALPGVYYLFEVVTPWTAFVPSTSGAAG